jgi:hypothetical protein
VAQVALEVQAALAELVEQQALEAQEVQAEQQALEAQEVQAEQQVQAVQEVQAEQQALEAQEVQAEQQALEAQEVLVVKVAVVVAAEVVRTRETPAERVSLGIKGNLVVVAVVVLAFLVVVLVRPVAETLRPRRAKLEHQTSAALVATAT